MQVHAKASTPNPDRCRRTSKSLRSSRLSPFITSSSALGARIGSNNATFRRLPWIVSGGDQCISVGTQKAPKALVNEKSRLRTGLCSSIQAETPYRIDIYPREICTLISTTTKSSMLHLNADRTPHANSYTRSTSACLIRSDQYLYGGQSVSA